MGREALREEMLRWNCAKPKDCRCPEAMLLNWDLVQVDWWDIWEKTA